MKKLFFAALIATTLATSAFATDANKVDVRIHNSFRAEYGSVENVKWSLRENFAKATFALDGKTIDVFYDTEGHNIGTSRLITLDEVPTAGKRMLAKKYADYTVTEAIQFDGVYESAYYISVDNNEETLVLKIDPTGIVSVFKRTAKD